MAPRAPWGPPVWGMGRPPVRPVPGGPIRGPMGPPLLGRLGPEGAKDLAALRFLLDPRVYDLLREKLRRM